MLRSDLTLHFWPGENNAKTWESLYAVVMTLSDSHFYSPLDGSASDIILFIGSNCCGAGDSRISKIKTTSLMHNFYTHSFFRVSFHLDFSFSLRSKRLRGLKFVMVFVDTFGGLSICFKLMISFAFHLLAYTRFLTVNGQSYQRGNKHPDWSFSDTANFPVVYWGAVRLTVRVDQQLFKWLEYLLQIFYHTAIIELNSRRAVVAHLQQNDYKAKLLIITSIKYAFLNQLSHLMFGNPSQYVWQCNHYAGICQSKPLI